MSEPERLNSAAVGDGTTLEALLTRVARMAVFAVRADGQVAYASPGIRDVMGFDPEEVVGTNVLDYLHPDDVERAVLSMTWRDADGRPPPGFSGFRARHTTWGYVDIEATASKLVHDGEEHLAIYARSVPAQTAEELLAIVLRGASRDESLRAALSSVSWEEHGSHVAIAWPDEGGLEQVSTGLPEPLTGVVTEGTGNPWAACLRTGRAVRRSVAELDDATAAIAKSVGLAEVWVEPVSWSEVEDPALVTIWAPGGLSLPEIHGYGMRATCNLTELVLRFTAGTRIQG
jgi:PAS domain S-box-containing protein